MEWQPIETAPDDGTTVLLFVPRRGGPDSIHEIDGRYVVGYCTERGEWFDRSTPCYEPTHWMPLPDPPDNEKEHGTSD